jgi:hypothetical protein
MKIFALTKVFPKEEKNSLMDQLRRYSGIEISETMIWFSCQMQFSRGINWKNKSMQDRLSGKY